MYRIHFVNRWDHTAEVFTFASRENIEVFEARNGDCTLILPAKTKNSQYPGVEIINISQGIHTLFTHWLSGSEYSEYSSYNGSGKACWVRN